ncbi:MAG TPA: cytochrome c biogenesis protein CcdA [Aggregatilineales bacterium]|nr:redoxin domain-containing protein [Anaerolineales bacterium]HRE46794.1 cytochrome c biogenesis protein CcdA [Aggregatilineales bacterium]
MTGDINLLVAFLGGVISFLSPCVLPLVPGYIGYLTARAAGQSVAELRAAGAGGAAIRVNRASVFLHGVFFVGGFTLVFIFFGLILSAGLTALQSISGNAQDAKLILQKVGGIVVIFFGLHMMGGTRWLASFLRRVAPNSPITQFVTRLSGWLYMDTRRQVDTNGAGGYAGSLLMGMFFGAGWSPCIGPILGGILTSASLATSGSAFLGAGVQMLVYSLGLGMPFLLTALALNRMRSLFKRIQRHMRAVELVSGSFMILVGVLLYTGELTRLANAGGALADFVYNLDGCVSGGTPLAEFGVCMQYGPDYKYILAGKGERPLPPTPAATPPVGVPDAAVNVVGFGVGQTPPDFRTTHPDGTPIALSDLRGEVVLLNFWATWCTPCKKEMPFFQEMLKTYSGKGFTVLAVNFLEDSAKIEAFLAAEGLDLPIAMDTSGAINRQYKVLGYPTTYIIGRDMRILAVQSGPFDLALFENALKGWLN